MISLIRLKSEIEAKKGTSMKVTFNGAAEAHLIADEIGTFTSLPTGTFALKYSQLLRGLKSSSIRAIRSLSSGI